MVHPVEIIKGSTFGHWNYILIKQVLNDNPELKKEFAEMLGYEIKEICELLDYDTGLGEKFYMFYSGYYLRSMEGRR